MRKNSCHIVPRNGPRGASRNILSADFGAEVRPAKPAGSQPEAIRQIARSIEVFGFVVPILVDASGKIIAGQGRISAAQLLGWSEVPTNALDHLTEAQVKAFMIADNRLTENSTWDDRLLAQHLKGLSLMELDFSLELRVSRWARSICASEGIEVTPRGASDPGDALPPAAGPQVSRAGDRGCWGATASLAAMPLMTARTMR